ncbi:hypothetical protein ES702_07483 [subsurface metagenome]
MKRAIGYIRVSTEEQAKNGLSLGSQETTIKTYAKLKKLSPVEIIVDSQSAKNLERKGMKRLILLCEQGEVSHLIVYKMDRLARNTRNLLELVEDVFVANDVVFHSVTESIDTKGPLGKFFLTVMGAMAQMEREQLAERITDAFEEKRRRGEPMGSAALGFKVKDKKRIEDPEGLEIVRYVKSLRRKKLSHQKIAVRLNEEGIPTKRGGRWHRSTVSYILKNESYKGVKLGV